ncbi:hypothetical protein LCGC14_1009980 [marine sediment metagenome]|uniref:HNH nuclease domain-containing protein n=1 Tax=marine sediment metagenome TaxID=412755 RepID=A0A0F9N506_9ZZZZ
MLAVKEKVVNNPDRFTERKCDNCGIKERARMSTIYRGRKRRRSTVDLCKKCSNLSQFRKCAFDRTGKNSVNWNGGIRINNGYRQHYLGKGAYRNEQRIIMEKHLNRSLKKKEKVHHIDCNKLNNKISNLYLCKNMREHSKCHYELERCGFKMLGRYIWFNYANNSYVLNKTKCKRSEKEADFGKTMTRTHTKRFGSLSYRHRYLGNQKYKTIHSIVVEEMLGRRLYANELVHHVDSNTLNNSPRNLQAMSRSDHAICHFSLQKRVSELYIQGIVVFENGFYKEK